MTIIDPKRDRRSKKGKPTDAGEGYGLISRTGTVRCALCGARARLGHLPRSRWRSTLRFHGWTYNAEIGWHHLAKWCKAARKPPREWFG